MKQEVTQSFEALLDALMKETEVAKHATFEAALNADMEKTVERGLSARRTERLLKCLARHYVAWCKAEGEPCSVDTMSEAESHDFDGTPF